MNSIILAGPAYNALARLAAPPVPTNANALFPVANLSDGRPDEPFIFGSTAGVQLDVDLTMVPNGSFEAAFVGGLPASATAGAAWGKTAGATLTRNTASPYAGAACLEVVGGQNEYGYVDVVCAPGERLAVLARARAAAAGLGNVARVRLQNLATGRWGNQDDTWTDDQAVWLQAETVGAYVGFHGGITVEDYATCGTDPVTIRVSCWGGSTAAPLYDDIHVWVVPSWISVHGHNIPPACGGLDVLTGFTAPPATLRGTLPIVRPTTHLYSTAFTVSDRFLRLALQAPPLVDPVHIGELVIGCAQVFQAARWGSEHTLTAPQDRSEDGLQAYLLTPELDQRARLQLRTRDAAEFQAVTAALTRARLGAWPLLVADADEPGSALLARVTSDWSYTREAPGVRDASLELRGLPLPNVVA